jgi:hypothetical protein
MYEGVRTGPKRLLSSERNRSSPASISKSFDEHESQRTFHPDMAVGYHHGSVRIGRQRLNLRTVSARASTLAVNTHSIPRYSHDTLYQQAVRINRGPNAD